MLICIPFFIGLFDFFPNRSFTFSSIFLLGIRKHTLDKPFTKTTGIDTEKKKGSKRSRRRAGFENRIEGNEVGAVLEEEL